MAAKTRFSIVSVSIMVSLVLSSCAPQEEPIRPNIRSMMMSVPAGRAWRATGAWRFGNQFAPNGSDLLNLMEIQGASYIVKAPASQAGGCYIEFDVRDFVDGKELSQKAVGAKDETWQGMSPSTMWVVDILAWPDWVSSSGYSYRIRIRPLDGGQRWQSTGAGFFKSPKHDPNTGGSCLNASLYQCAQREVGLEKDVPLACLSEGPIDKSYKPAAACGADDPELLARASRYGIVFCIRLRQKPATPAPDQKRKHDEPK